MNVRWPVRGLRCALGPRGECGEAAISVRRRAGRRVEGALERLAGGEAVRQGVVEGEDAVLRAVAAVGFLVLAPNDREGVHDVCHRVARGGPRLQQFGRCGALPLVGCAEVEVEERGVELAADLETPRGVVAEDGSVALGPEVARERGHVVGGGGEFEDAGGYFGM